MDASSVAVAVRPPERWPTTARALFRLVRSMSLPFAFRVQLSQYLWSERSDRSPYSDGSTPSFRPFLLELLNDRFDLRGEAKTEAAAMLLGLERCPNCDCWEWPSLLTLNGDDFDWCPRCRTSFLFTCRNCGELANRENSRRYGGLMWCEECADKYLYTCDGCGETIHQEDVYRNDDDDDENVYCAGCFEAQDRMGPVCEVDRRLINFQLPALCLPEKVLKSDQLAVITMGGGEVSNTARVEIEMLMKGKGLYLSEMNDGDNDWWDGIGNEWQSKEGNWPKRFAKFLVQQADLKPSDQLLAQIGSIAKEHSTEPQTLYVSITRQLNGVLHHPMWSPQQQFANENSCFFGSYAVNRCILKEIGGFALRTFEPGKEARFYQEGRYVVQPQPVRTTGRCWVVPAIHGIHGDYIHPTSNIEDATCYVVINPYHDNSAISHNLFARVLAQLTGMSYTARKAMSSELYLNGDTAWLVAPPEVTVKYSVKGTNLPPLVVDSYPDCGCSDSHKRGD